MADQDEIIKLLRDQILAEQAKAAELKRQNDLAEAMLELAQRDYQNRTTAERNRLKIALDTNEKVSGLIAQLSNENVSELIAKLSKENVSRFLTQLPQVFLAIHQIAEWLHERDKRDDRLERILLMLLGRIKTDEVTETITELQRSQWQRQLQMHIDNLNEKEEQKAHYGIDVPLDITNSIKREKEEIEKLNHLLR